MINKTGEGATVQTSTLNEELGNIKHIFTDKTGTLTCNNLILKNISIYGTSFENVQKFENS